MIGCSEGGKEADWLFCPIAAEPAGKQANSNNYTDGSERTGSLYAHSFQQGIRPAKAFESAHLYIYLLTYHLLLCLRTQAHKTLNLLHPDSFIQYSDWSVDVCDSQTYNPFNFFTARHKLLRQNTRTELQMRPRCIFAFSRFNRMLPCSVTLDAPLTALKPCLTPDRSTPNKNHLPLADSFFVLMILAAYSWPDDIFTHRLTTENAPLKKREKKREDCEEKNGHEALMPNR